MGVHGLWDLLSPVGRRVSVETLAGKRLSIDASIWMIQFMKAMRDEKGEMVRNAHLLGFFRRICKLLFLRTKPVFVFDGGTPALKRRTVIARRRQRENAQAKIRKTAEKLLLNHLKALRLKELAKELENQRESNDTKGKKVFTDETDMEEDTQEGNDMVSGSYNQEELDEMLAASLAAEEDGRFTSNASTSGAAIPAEEEDADEDEEMILPAINGKVDPAVLAALPPSMQLDLLVQMRERLMAENRQKYQKVKKVPAVFSELQIQSYLKTVAFRREIHQVQKSAAGRGIGGVQTSRIASEANREFIFSSSFTGDKQVLASGGVETSDIAQHETPMVQPSSDSAGCVTSVMTSAAATNSIVDEPGGEFENDVETYLDERGRVRVSRVRAMGIRMTRDLQRNLDLIKEIEDERADRTEISVNDLSVDKNLAVAPRKIPNKVKLLETSKQGNDGVGHLNEKNEEPSSGNGISVEISFENDGVHQNEDEDELFASLVAGDPVMTFSPDNTPLEKQSCDSASDCEWEEGAIDDKHDAYNHDNNMESRPFLAEGNVGDESEVEWEEEFSDKSKPECGTGVSKGSLEEEANLEEAIRRSLEDLRDQEHRDASSEDYKPKPVVENTNQNPFIESLYQKGGTVDPELDNVFQPIKSSCDVLAGTDNLEGIVISKTSTSSAAHFTPSEGVHPDKMEVMIEKPHKDFPASRPELSRQDVCGSDNSFRNAEQGESVTSIDEDDVDLIKKNVVDTCCRNAELATCTDNCSRVTSRLSGSLSVILGYVNGAQQNETESASDNHNSEVENHKQCDVKDSKTSIDVIQNLTEEKDHVHLSKTEVHAMENFTFMDDKEEHTEVTEASLQEELQSIHRERTDLGDEQRKLFTFMDDKEEHTEVTEASLQEELQSLHRERTDLGDEQRKLERNAESVSSEMFAECQELLQMFGLPYIIAPMEAEAQCAYMELMNLVDGVVTDDSDVFLFGARSVYKNIFDDRKYVETYFMKDIEDELGLTREKLIRMALLLGSDYTEGVSGIGIVNAIEVVNAFPEEDGFHKFREWIESPDPSILGKIDAQAGSISRNKGSKFGDNDVSSSTSNAEGSSANASQSVDHLQTTKQIFMDKHRNVSKNWHLPSTFPSEAVFSAYASPQVDKSTDPFSWGKPDLFVLRKLCWEKFGWGNQKADELLLPVLKEYNKHETQLRLEAFYTFNERFAKIRSKRIKKAVKGITGNKSSEAMDDSVQDVSKRRKKRKMSTVKAGDGKSEEASSGIGAASSNESNPAEKSTAKKSRKRKQGKTLSSDARNSGPPIARGSGRGRGKKRGRSLGRGRKKDDSGGEYAETSSDDGKDGFSDPEVVAAEYEKANEIRRSTRSRKVVKYNMSDADASEEVDQNHRNFADIEVVEEVPSGIVGSTAADPSTNNELEVKENEYLEVGGGFCTDEADPQIRPGQSGDHEDLSMDYLQTGGGFCSDEDQVDKELAENAYSPLRDIAVQNPNPGCSSGLGEEAGHESVQVQSVSSPIRSFTGERRRNTDEHDSEQNVGHPTVTTADSQSLVAMSEETVKKDDPGTGSVSLLSAMPNLRRKRRKT